MRPKKRKVTFAVTGDAYDKFKDLAASMGLSASSLLDIIIIMCVKYSDRVTDIFELQLKKGFLDDVVNVLMGKDVIED